MSWTRRLLQVLEEVQDRVPDTIASLFQGAAIGETSRNGRHLGEDYILSLAVDNGVTFDSVHGVQCSTNGYAGNPFSAIPSMTSLKWSISSRVV